MSADPPDCGSTPSHGVSTGGQPQCRPHMAAARVNESVVMGHWAHWVDGGTSFRLLVGP